MTTGQTNIAPSLLQRRTRTSSDASLKKSLPPRHLSVCVGNGFRCKTEIMSPTDTLLSPVASKIEMVHRRSEPEITEFGGVASTLDRDDVMQIRKISILNTPSCSSPLATPNTVSRKVSTPKGDKELGVEGSDV